MLPFHSTQNAAAERTLKSDSVEEENMMEKTKRTGILAGIETLYTKKLPFDS